MPELLPEGPLPLIVMFHGATSDPERGLRHVRAEAERRGCLVLATKSRGSTWDLLQGGYGFDVAVLDYSLKAVFCRFPVDPRRVAVAGFSDGASYALSLGLINGLFFSQVIAFSPGFVAPGPWQGRPAIFVSHGREDTVLPISRCGRPAVDRLREAGYRVHYREFDGGHVVPPDITVSAMDDFEANAREKGVRWMPARN
ncbi:alpha/beta hydrolase [Roseococcus sp. YIM B11640]|uniref:alpha/beta hydrolase n=1 Tax=Roseococcus sp. YIM B11640 TaxID=3133973 RepID=UPI003C7C7ECD